METPSINRKQNNKKYILLFIGSSVSLGVASPKHNNSRTKKVFKVRFFIDFILEKENNIVNG